MRRVSCARWSARGSGRLAGANRVRNGARTLVLGTALALCAGAGAATADTRSKMPVTVIAGAPGGTALDIAHDLSAALDDGTNLRILPIAGRGSIANVADLIGLGGVDLAITQIDALTHLKSSAKLGPGLDNRIGIIAKLHDAELHILAGSGIERVDDLNGKTVNLCSRGSGTEFTARTVLERLGVKVRSINVSHDAGLAKVASGEIAATMLVTGKPARALEGRMLPPGIKLLSVPYTSALEDDYLPAALTGEDYPGLVPQGQRVATIGVGVLLVGSMPGQEAQADPRIPAFVELFFSGINTLHLPAYHRKWRDTNLSVALPGWRRHPAAEAWLSTHGSGARHNPPAQTAIAAAEPAASAPSPASDPMLAFALAARAAAGNPAEQERLFQQFLALNRSRPPAVTAATTEAGP